MQFLRYKNVYLRNLQIWINSEQQDHLLEIREKQKTVRKWRALFRGTDVGRDGSIQRRTQSAE